MRKTIIILTLFVLPCIGLLSIVVIPTVMHIATKDASGQRHAPDKASQGAIEETQRRQNEDLDRLQREVSAARIEADRQRQLEEALRTKETNRVAPLASTGEHQRQLEDARREEAERLRREAMRQSQLQETPQGNQASRRRLPTSEKERQRQFEVDLEVRERRPSALDALDSVGNRVSATPPSSVAPVSAPPQADEGDDDDAQIGQRRFSVGWTPPCALVACTAIQVFFGSDRARQSHVDRIDLGSDRARRLLLGSAIVTVPRVAKRKIGEVLRPTWWERRVLAVPSAGLPDRHFTIPAGGVTLYATEEAFLNAVRAQIRDAASFKDHAFVFVHGYATTFEHALYRTAQLAYDLGGDGQPFGTAFLYSWPSGGGVPDYKHDFDSARLSVDYLTNFLRLVAQRSNAKLIHLIAHSMGNWPLLTALNRLETSPSDRMKLGQVILAAPDVDVDEFEGLTRKARQAVQGITLYASSNDTAMMVSRKVHRGLARAGDIPNGKPVLVSGIDTIDISAVSTDLLSFAHSEYAERRELLNDLALVLREGVRPPPKRTPVLRSVRGDQGEWWRFPN